MKNKRKRFAAPVLALAMLVFHPHMLLYAGGGDR